MLGAARRMGSRALFKEVKRKLDKTENTFTLEMWMETKDVVVGKWIAPADNVYGVQKGAYSWGVWPLGEEALWGAYRMHEADGTLSQYRFDALENSRFENGTLIFEDLLLDAAIEKDRVSVKILDQDEVDEAIKTKLLSLEQIKKIKAFEKLVIEGTVPLLDQVDFHISQALSLWEIGITRDSS